MAYRFKLENNPSKGFKRIVREQVQLALGELGAADAPSAVSVHASRKALKRLRALIAAVKPAIGGRAARKHDRALRDIGRMLSGRRDADVSLDTVAKLEAHYGESARIVLKPLRVHLEELAAATAREVGAAAVQSVADLMGKEGKALLKIKWSGRGFAPVLSGIAKSYALGRITVGKTFKAPDDERMHDLRKCVQAHWRHMALLSRAWPEAFAVRILAAHELSQLLGEDHDLSVLKAVAGNLREEDREAIQTLCVRRQKELRVRAEPRARRLFLESERAFARRMRGYLDVASSMAAAAAEITEAAEPARVATDEEPLRLAAKMPV